ncbi:MAG: ABC transporter permease [Pseudoxanthomonas sp.]
MSALKTLWVVMRKELVDLFRDRRTLLLTIGLGPVLMPLLLLGIGTLGEKRVKALTEKPLELPVVGKEHAPNLIAWLEGQNVTIKAPPQDIPAAIANQQEDLVMRISADYGKHWRASEPAAVEILFDSTRQDAQVPVQRLQGLLGAYGAQVGSLRLFARGVNPGAMAAVQVQRVDLATMEAQRGRFAALFLPYFLILSVFIGGAHVVFDSTAGERERQSLEPLLATPAPRGGIVSGKLAAACAVSMLSIVLILLSFKLTAQFSPTVGRQMSVSFGAMAQLLAILLPMAVIGTSLLTFLAASAKSMKEAQSHIGWLMLLPMIPSIVLMVNPLKTELWQFCVPFLSQNQLILKVVRGEVVSAQQWGVYLACALTLATLLWFGAVRRYHNEQLAISG